VTHIRKYVLKFVFYFQKNVIASLVISDFSEIHKYEGIMYVRCQHFIGNNMLCHSGKIKWLKDYQIAILLKAHLLRCPYCLNLWFFFCIVLPVFLNFILLFLYLLTCVYMPQPPLVLQFCWRKTYKIKKKSIAFLLEMKLAILGDSLCWFHACVYNPNWFISTRLHYSLPIVASASLRLLHSLLHSEHINHIQVNLWFFNL
jgi:hypothetical protein